jgi:hypothetical protein
MSQIWITPYNIPTKKCVAPSGTFPGADTVGRCARMIAPANSKRVSCTRRLALIDLDGTNGLVVSDIPYVCS